MKLIDRQPLKEEKSEVWMPDGIAVIKPFQIHRQRTTRPGRAVPYDPAAVT
jgi:hypothetical protein